MRYGIVIEKAQHNFAAYVPDLPGCAVTGETLQDVERDIREAVKFHLEGLREDGMAMPEATSIFEYVEAGE